MTLVNSPQIACVIEMELMTAIQWRAALKREKGKRLPQASTGSQYGGGHPTRKIVLKNTSKGCVGIGSDHPQVSARHCCRTSRP